LRGLPQELSAANDLPEEMPWPRVLVIRPSKRGWYLDRFTEGGESGGDTWHQELDEAREQADEEYGGSVSKWREVPPDMADDELVTYALSNVSVDS
jgi:hypothetical protein